MLSVENGTTLFEENLIQGVAKKYKSSTNVKTENPAKRPEKNTLFHVIDKKEC